MSKEERIKWAQQSAQQQKKWKRGEVGEKGINIVSKLAENVGDDWAKFAISNPKKRNEIIEMGKRTLRNRVKALAKAKPEGYKV